MAKECPNCKAIGKKRTLIIKPIGTQTRLLRRGIMFVDTAVLKHELKN